MKFIMLIAKIFVRLIYSFLKVLPTKNKVVMMSRRNSKISIDFELLRKEIINFDKKTKVIMLNHKFNNILLFIPQLILEMYHLATSKACITDSYMITISILKHKKQLKIIQIWHALGAIKKFGYAALDKPEGSSKELATLMNMHKNYTYIISGSEEMTPYFAKAFGVDDYNILPYSLPRVDYLLDKANINADRDRIFNTYKGLKDKKTILYAPTFRKNERLEVDELISKVDFSKFNLIIKKHPIDDTVINEKEHVIIDEKYDVIELLAIADYVITDYSAVIFEASILEIPQFFYVYDIDQYKNNRGFFIDYYKEVPGFISKDAKEIIDAIENNVYQLEKIKKFKEKYVSVLDQTSAEKIVALIKVGDIYANFNEELNNKTYGKIYMD